MKSLDYLNDSRLMMLPDRYKAAHEFCFYIHDKLLLMFKEYDSSGVHNTVLDAFQESLKGKENKFEDMDILKFMKDNGLLEPYRHHVLSHTIMALTGDMLNFIYEALCCFEKRKFSVAFSLLRKPIKEHLFFLTWILADEDDFIRRFEANNHKSFNRLEKEERITIIEKAINTLPLKEAFNAEKIWNIIYSKKFSNGFEPTWQKATHLTTSHGELLKTKAYSLNFIFDDSNEDSYYDFLSLKLPIVFIYLSQVILEVFNKIQPVNQKTITHLLLTIMGCFEATFGDGRKMVVTPMIQKEFKDFLKCLHCDSEFKLKKANAAELYLHERFQCENCGLESELPLYWIMAQANISLSND